MGNDRKNWDGEMHSREAITFAFVAAAYGAGKGALHGLTPLFGSCVSRQAGNLFEASTISQMVKDTFDLDVSPLVVTSMVPALLDAGYLSELKTMADGTIYKCAAIAKTSNEDRVERGVCEVFDRFRAFANTELLKSGLSVTADRLDAALLECLVHPEVLGLTLRQSVKFKQGQLTLKRPAPDPIDSVESAVRYLCADFITQTLMVDDENKQSLLQASWGALVSQVVLELQRPDSPTDFQDVSIFIDAPIILDALEVGEENASKFAKELLALLERAGATPVIFRHSIEEMLAILATSIHNFDLGYEVSGPLGSRLRRNPQDLARIRMILNSLERKLAEIGVRIEEEPSEPSGRGALFPEAYIDELRIWIAGEEVHLHVERDLRDAKSVAYTIQRRGAAPATSLSCSGAVFISKNRHVLAISKRFVEAKKLGAAYQVPVILTDDQLAGILWFSVGSASEEDANKLTQFKLAANCAKLVEPSPELVSTMRQYLTDPDGVREFEALLRNDRSALCLTREASRPLSLTNADDADRILDAMKNATAEEVRLQLHKEFEETRKEREAVHQTALLERDTKLEDFEEKIFSMESTHFAERNKWRSEKNSLEERLAAIERNVKTAGDRQRAAVIILQQQADAVEERTTRRVKIELFALYLLLFYWSLSAINTPIAIILSVVVAGLGFWFAPEFFFGKLAVAAGKADREKVVAANESVIGELSAAGMVGGVEPSEGNVQ